MEVVDSSKNTVSLLEFFGNNARRDSSAPIAEPPRADFALLCEAGRRRRKGNKLRPLRQVEREEERERRKTKTNSFCASSHGSGNGGSGHK